MLNRVAFAARSPVGVLSGLLCSGILCSGIMFVPTHARAQAGAADLMYRIERLENQIRQMTGDIEQLQYRNQQLEAAVNEMRYQDQGRGAPRVAAAPAAAPLYQQPAPTYQQPAPPMGGSAMPAPVMSGGGRRGDAFDPDANPYAPGAPRTLGSTPPQAPPPMSRPGMGPTPYATGAAGADPGYGRPAGAEADYGRPPAAPPPRNAGSSPYAVATAPPPGSGSSQEMYEAGVSSLQRRDYAAAEDAFRDFLRRYPSDRRAGDAQFNLGESLYQRQSYQEAADAFVALSKKYENSPKAPEALLRLGQSLVALNERELACVAFGDVGRKYPRAQSTVKQAIDREQKRARC
jgi:tol-pal system protein YbgF